MLSKGRNTGFVIGFCVGVLVTMPLFYQLQQKHIVAGDGLTVSTMIIAKDNTNNDNSNVVTSIDGWKNIQVFYGADTHLLIHEGNMAQALQDTIVSMLFNDKKHGYYIDLAANDATYLSNTYNLERYHNWTGLCIEPNPEYWRSLSYRKCDVIACVIGHDTMEEVNFRIDNDGALGGIIRSDFANKPADDNTDDRTATKYFTVTIHEVLERANAPKEIDYLSLDVEGAEFYIMSSFPFDDYTINVLTIERPSIELQELLRNKNYELLCYISEFGETIWAYKPSIDTILNITRINSRCVQSVLNG